MTITPSEHAILVSGATGQQGGAVARHLLKRGFRVRALTRNPEEEAARALADQGAEIVQGDFDDRASLDRALENVYGAFSVQGWFEEGTEAEIRRGKAFADAANDAGVQHFVYSSAGGAERETGVPHLDSKGTIEAHIRALELPATILRPVFFMDNWTIFAREALLGGRLPQPLSPSTTLQQIAVDDIGMLAALAFAHPDAWIGRARQIAGDERTMAEIAAAFGRVLNREVEYVQVPWDAFEAQSGEEITVMYRWFEADGFGADVEVLRDEYPDLQRFESFLRHDGWATADEQG